MLLQEVNQLHKNITNDLQKHHLQKAFTQVRLLIDELQEWSCNEKLSEIETSYRYMIQYMLNGISDPERHNIHQRLIAETYELTDTVCDKLLQRTSSHLYYEKKRYYEKKSFAQGYAALDAGINELSLCELIPDDSNTIARRKAVEQQASDFFELVWTNFPAQSEDYAVLREALQPHHLPEPIAAIIVSAIMLNTLHNFDEEKLEILIDTYLQHDSEEVQIRALCAIHIIILHHYTRLSLHNKIRHRISLLLDNKQFDTDSRNILFQIIRCRDTEKISRKMTEEVLPKMMKISPSLYKKIEEDDALNDLESLEHNPEWQEILDEAGISENIMEINDLQMQGADVFMSTFAQLKHYPFFRSISNWFMPFMPNHTILNELYNNDDWSRRFANLLKDTGFLCNSDKYSFCITLSEVPEQQRKMMATQFGSESNELNEQAKTELYRQSRERENISNRYIQDLYRFNKLFNRRKEFVDIFNKPIEDILQIEAFAPITHDEKMLKILGEYFFKNEYYNDAIGILNMLTHSNFSDSELYQKLGYCHQSKGEYNEALENYLKADLIAPNKVWTLRHIAICYRNIKKTEKALEYFLRAQELTPNNLSVNLNIGHCYLEQKAYEEALKYYFRVDYLDSKGTKARRPIAWCSFLAGKTEQALRYYEKILADRPNALDFLNAGHVTLVTGNINKALTLYVQSIKADENNLANFTRSFEQDTPDLINAGINADDIPIIYDQIIYQLQEENQ